MDCARLPSCRRVHTGRLDFTFESPAGNVTANQKIILGCLPIQQYISIVNASVFKSSTEIFFMEQKRHKIPNNLVAPIIIHLENQSSNCFFQDCTWSIGSANYQVRFLRPLTMGQYGLYAKSQMGLWLAMHRRNDR